MHFRTGETLEKHLGDHKQKSAAELAFHFESGRAYEQAVSYCLLATEAEMSKFALPQAEAFCDRALSAIRKLPADRRTTSELSAVELRGQTRASLGRLNDAVKDFETMERLSDEIGDVGARARSLSNRLVPLHFLGRSGDLAKVIDELKQLGQEIGSADLIALAEAVTAVEEIMVGRVDSAVERYATVQREVRGLDSAFVVAAVRQGAANANFLQGNYSQTVDAYAELRDAMIEARDGMLLLNGLLFGGMTHGNLGQFADALSAFEEGLRLAEQNGERFWIGRYPNSIAWLYFESFDFARAIDLGLMALEKAKESGCSEPVAHSEINLGLALMEAGDLERCREELQRADQLEGLLEWRWRQRLEAAWSEYWLQAGDETRAKHHAENCRKRAVDTSGGKYLVLSLRQLARIALKEGNPEEARSILGAASDALRDENARLIAWRLHHTWAEYHRAIGDKEAAERSMNAVDGILLEIERAAPDDMASSIRNYRGTLRSRA